MWEGIGSKKERKKDTEEERKDPVYKSNHVAQLFKIFHKVSILYFLIIYNDHLLL